MLLIFWIAPVLRGKYKQNLSFFFFSFFFLKFVKCSQLCKKFHVKPAFFHITQVAETKGNDENQSTPCRNKLPVTSQSPRPFTNMIDKLIEKEKSLSIASEKTESTICKSPSVASSHGRNTKIDKSKGKMFGMGPLPAPILSSTQRSDLMSNATNSPYIQHASRTKAKLFEPLPVYSGETNSLESASLTSNVDANEFLQNQHLIAERDALVQEQNMLKQAIVEQQRQTGEPIHVDIEEFGSAPPSTSGSRVTFHSPVYTNMAQTPPLPNRESDLGKYYSNLAPAERERQILMQKRALLEEQARLKSILAQQEKLLRTKQDQLHHQQKLQKHRLEFFKETGYFPSSVGMDQYSSDLVNVVDSITDINGTSTNPSVASLNAADHFGSRLAQLTNATHSNLGNVSEERLTKSMENLRFLLSHGVDVPQSSPGMVLHKVPKKMRNFDCCLVYR